MGIWFWGKIYGSQEIDTSFKSCVFKCCESCDILWHCVDCEVEVATRLQMYKKKKKKIAEIVVFIAFVNIFRDHLISVYVHFRLASNDPLLT